MSADSLITHIFPHSQLSVIVVTPHGHRTLISPLITWGFGAVASLSGPAAVAPGALAAMAISPW